MKVFGELFTATIVTNFCQAVTLKAFLFNNRTENLVVKTIYTAEASSQLHNYQIFKNIFGDAVTWSAIQVVADGDVVTRVQYK